MIENPNEYDDEAFLEASNLFQSNVTDLLDTLWRAGASQRNIEEEIANALENMEAGVYSSPRVEISCP